jgi:photosystem II stability/assembly factor-like uncharacterized protein
MKTKILPVILGFTLLLAACQRVTPPPAPTPTPLPQPTATTIPTATATAVPTLTVSSPAHPVSISQIHMTDAQNGLAIGGDFGRENKFLKTTDGGKTWLDLTPVEDRINGANATWNLTAGFYGPDHIWLLVSPVDLTQPESAKVMYSKDGGQTFEFSKPLPVQGLDESFFGGQIQFIDENTGWLLAHVGAGMNHDYIALYQTGDGGNTWIRLVDPMTNDAGIQSCTKNDMYFMDDQNGYLTGTCNGVAAGVLFYKTRNGGKSWAQVVLPEPSDQPGLFTNQDVNCGSYFPQMDQDKVVHISVACQFYNTTPQTTSSYSYTLNADGATWTIHPYPGGYLFFLDSKMALTAGLDWQRSGDGAAAWSELELKNLPAKQIDLVTPNLLYAVTQDDTHSQLLVSNDAGLTWTEILPGLQ